ncbi:Uncharacterized protein C8034_v001946 [Colletotrichum sidae]|uniref:MOZ protein represents a chromatin-associated acetyltransferase n=1 Tax=Colletotrichum sidae TaxID=1347389 RepID=A0A4R8SS44_9PEZI|nr:Uncharacterized protein C8034_v001946 [Colletotrichum sidae]
MSTTRLTFLYPPHLFRALRASRSTCRRRPVPQHTAATSRGRSYAAFAPTYEARASSFAPRHGKGVEPLTVELESLRESEAELAGETAAISAAAATATVSASASAATAAGSSGTTTTTTTPPSPPTPPPPPPPQSQSQSQPQSQNPEDAEPETDEGKAAKQEARDQAKKSGPLEAILHMSTPAEVARSHPHMAPTPYVHHFDSYSLVKQLEGGGYSEEQAITAMKAIRAILEQNLDVAQASLVSKSDVENETYLFRAACSELGTEVKNNQKLADEEMRQKRTLLQHEVDILTQSLNQELLTLNDTVRGMFNDRKMAVREEQTAGESVIQQINYKISLHLSSDAKSEIEGLRWILIRRSVIGILFMAVLTLGTLRYGTYVSHEKQKEADRMRKQAELIKQADGKRDHSSAPDAAEILAAN